jgi:hypothetical protein
MVIRPDIPIVKRDGRWVHVDCNAGTEANNHSVNDCKGGSL